MKVKLCLIFVLLYIFYTDVFAQSTAVEIETLLATDAVTYAQASRFVLEASNTLVTFDQNEALRYALGRNWLPGRASSNQRARLDDVSLLVLNSFGIKGGLFYLITKKSHYAYRELVYRNYIQGRTYPSMDVSGELLLFIIGRILTDREREETGRHNEALAAQNVAKEAASRREEVAAELAAMIKENEMTNITVEIGPEGITIILFDIGFTPDSTQLLESERVKLRAIANILKNIPNVRLLISGHTALAGTAEGRRRISQGRAQIVASYLVSLGACKADNVVTVGYESDRPIADNTTAEGMAANRRVEIVILED
ncbi:MAG: OmpA family protein [Treponema sp.]|nr:OmpA family protein [Treponema sp.]